MMAEPYDVSDLQKRILKFYRDQPQAVETAKGVATWVGAERDSVEEALNGLAVRGWLARDETSAVTGYALTRDDRRLAQIDKLLEAS